MGLFGREMFSFNPDLIAENDVEDGDEAFDAYVCYVPKMRMVVNTRNCS